MWHKWQSVKRHLDRYVYLFVFFFQIRRSWSFSQMVWLELACSKRGSSIPLRVKTVKKLHWDAVRGHPFKRWSTCVNQSILVGQSVSQSTNQSVVSTRGAYLELKRYVWINNLEDNFQDDPDQNISGKVLTLIMMCPWSTIRAILDRKDLIHIILKERTRICAERQEKEIVHMKTRSVIPFFFSHCILNRPTGEQEETHFQI